MFKLFLTKCTDGSKVENTEVQLIEKVQEGNITLRRSGKYFTISHRTNST